MIKIVLLGEPVGKGRPRFVRATGRAYTPEKTQRYEGNVAWAAQVAMAGRKPLDGALSVALTVFMGLPTSKSAKWKAAALAGELLPTKKPDIDNAMKGVFDACNKIVWIDDSQVVTAFVCKRYSDQPRMEIIVEPCLTHTN